jgi:hypothetical protein
LDIIIVLSDLYTFLEHFDRFCACSEHIWAYQHADAVQDALHMVYALDELRCLVWFQLCRNMNRISKFLILCIIILQNNKGRVLFTSNRCANQPGEKSTIPGSNTGFVGGLKCSALHIFFFTPSFLL